MSVLLTPYKSQTPGGTTLATTEVKTATHRSLLTPPVRLSRPPSVSISCPRNEQDGRETDVADRRVS